MSLRKKETLKYQYRPGDINDWWKIDSLQNKHRKKIFWVGMLMAWLLSSVCWYYLSNNKDKTISPLWSNEKSEDKNDKVPIPDNNIKPWADEKKSLKFQNIESDKSPTKDICYILWYNKNDEIFMRDKLWNVIKTLSKDGSWKISNFNFNENFWFCDYSNVLPHLPIDKKNPFSQIWIEYEIPEGKSLYTLTKCSSNQNNNTYSVKSRSWEVCYQEHKWPDTLSWYIRWDYLCFPDIGVITIYVRIFSLLWEEIAITWKWKDWITDEEYTTLAYCTNESIEKLQDKFRKQILY